MLPKLMELFVKYPYLLR